MLRHALNLGRRLWSGPMGPLRYPEVSITGAITLDSSAWNRWHVCSGTSANYQVTLPSTTGHKGDTMSFRMSSALTKLVTLRGSGSDLIDAALPRVMWAGESAVLLCDGSNWFKIDGKSIPMTATMFLGTSQTGVVTATVTKINVDSMALNNTGLMTDTTNKRINIVRPAVYTLSGCVVWANISAAGVRFITMLYASVSGGASGLVNNTEQGGAAGGYPSSLAQTSLALIVNDYAELRAYHNVPTTDQSVLGGATLASGPCFLSCVEILAW